MGNIASKKMEEVEPNRKHVNSTMLVIKSTNSTISELKHVCHAQKIIHKRQLLH